MTRFALLLATLTVAGPALAQTTAPAPGPTAPAPAATPGPMMPPPEFMTAAQTFGRCIETAIRAAPATGTAAATAHTAWTGCASQKAALDARFETWVAGPGFPAEGRAMARQQYAQRMSGAEAQIAAHIGEIRASATPAPTASPTPAAPR